MRSRIVCLVGVAALSLVATSTAAPAPAASPSNDPGVLDRAARAVNPSRAYTVTLITGDTVHVAVTPDGTYQTRTELAPRPDGRTVVATTLTGGGHTYVLPSDAAGLVAAGRLDRRLFDVEQLIADGYGGRRAGPLPVIVQYRGEPALGAKSRAQLYDRADALPASRPTRTLESINGVALDVSSAGARQFWSSVSSAPSPTGRATLDAGLTRVWLDERVEASLDQSVPMIGAPQAWAAGYDGTGVRVAVLDSGIDATHPDLEGTVDATKSFVPDVDSVADGNGHGTHVASTVVGSGAASDGSFRGVAPGARLVIGKVLDDSGNGLSSWIIDGMEWAAQTQDAPIVSMSLGSRQPSDGTDPMSQAVNELTASTGALFVIAAGNSGPAARSIGAPGAADSAFTVAAVDKSDQLASFSSRGPRLTDYAFKPDIAGPGVDITAARAAGTALGPIVDEHYTTISGTSMATPHVAGAAAILLQEHPEWTAEQLKAALASTSKDDGYAWYEQGAGRIDVATAYTATVLAETAKVDFGRLRYPQSGPPLTRTVTYRNDGDEPVTLSLSTQLASESGAAPDGMITVSPDTIEVPAGGTAEATVSLDPTVGDPGLYSGAVLAAADGVALRTPIGTYKEPEGFELSVQTILPDDVWQSQLGTVAIRRVDIDDGQWTVLPNSGSTSVHLDKGVYSIAQTAVWADQPANIDNMAFLAEPEVDLSSDTTVTLDATEAVRLDPQIARETEILGTTMSDWRVPAGSDIPYGVVTGRIPYQISTWATPTPEAETGEFYFEHNHLMGTPLITAEVPRHGKQPALRLHPRYQYYEVEVPKLDGRMNLDVVDVGSGSAEEFANVNVRGKVALIDVGDKGLAPLLGLNFAREELENAAEAGAAAVFGYGDEGIPALGNLAMTFGAYPAVPTVALPAEDGEALRDRVSRGRTSVRIESRPSIPDLYTLSYLEQKAIPASARDRVRDNELATLETTIHGDRPVATGQYWSPERPTIVYPDGLSRSYAGLLLDDIPGPLTRTEHIGPVSAATLWNRRADAVDLERMRELDQGHVVDVFLGSTFGLDVFDRASFRREEWGEAPTVPGMYLPDPAVVEQLKSAGELLCAACRYAGVFPGGDLLPLLTMNVDAAGHYGEITSYSNDPLTPGSEGVDEWHLYADGVELPQESLTGKPGELPYYVLPTEPADYRLTEHYVDGYPRSGYGTRADTTWTFSSQAPTGKEVPEGYDLLGLCADKCGTLPLIFLRYDFDLRADNRLPAPGVHSFVVTAYRQPSSSAMPRLTKFTLQASFDEGRHWKPVPAIPLGNGRYRAVLPHPPLRDQAGSVSLRVDARDAAGNRVQQVLHQAYGLVRRH